jgi:phage baseplate assembly protein gpV
MSILDKLAETLTGDETEPKIYGVVVGRVINIVDPLVLNRVQVQIPDIDALDTSPWCRIASPAASMASGFYWIPNIEDEVLVAFEQGNINAPYVVGCLWSAIMVPPLPSPVGVNIRMLRTPLGNQIIFTEAPPGILIQTAGLVQSILMVDTPPSITITSGTNIISMSPAGITLTGSTINIVGETAVTITAPTVSVIGQATTTVGSPASPCVISGLPVAIN